MSRRKRILRAYEEILEETLPSWLTDRQIVWGLLALGVVGVGSFLHYLDLASRGDIPPSQVSNFAGSGLDDPSSTYLFGVVLCAAFSLLCTVYILYTVRRDRRRAPRPHRE